MKQNLLKSAIRLIFVFLLGTTLSFAQENINLLAGNYDQDPYPKYDPTGNILGTYTIRTSKSAHTFTDGQFTINVAFPPGAVYAGNANLPAGFSILSGSDGSSSVVIGITGSWSGTGPTALRTFVLPIKIVGPSTDQPTGTVLVWNDPFINENPVANSTGSPLNVTNVLPVTLTAFIATKENSTAFLKWSTTFETNSDHFEVQRSSNGKNWNEIGIVASNGESTSLKDYSFTDTKPMRGENLYRLKMIDKDQSFAYSRIQGVRFEDTVQDLSVYPNPSADFVYIRDAGNVEEVSVTDLKGNTVYQSGELEKGEINVKNLLAGPYAVKVLRKNGQTTVQKIIVVK